MSKKKKQLPMEGRIMSGVTTAAPSPWREYVHPEGKIVVFERWCKKCGICTTFCPTGALETNEDGYPFLANPEKCTLCGLCWMRCPDLAIIRGPEIPENKPTEESAEKTRAMLCEAGDKDSCEMPPKDNKKKEGKS